MTILWTIACGLREQADPAELRLDIERRTLQTSEQALLWRTARQAMADRDDRTAVRAVLLGLEIDPERFAPLAEALSQSDDPEVLGALSERAGLERLSERAELLRLERDYGLALRAATAARFDRVERVMAERILAGIEAEYVAEPDLHRMEAAAERRFARMASSGAVRAAFPSWSGAADGQGILGRIDGAAAAGLPLSVAVGEGIEAALGGLDPYTLPIWPSALTGWEEHHQGASVGIGVELLEAPEGGVAIGLLSPAGPAWWAGVHSGDRVIAIDGIAPGDRAEAAGRLRGEAGAEVALTIDRGGRTLSLSVVREEIREETVRGRARLPDGGWDPWIEPRIALIRISGFRPHTDEELDALIPAEPGAVILDLRGNGGGDVMAAVNVADRFVADGDLVWLVGRTVAPPVGGERGELPWNVAIPGHPLEGVPVAVLVDRQTASAAELVAGALRERTEAALIGEQTWGKGLSQALRVDEAVGVGWQVSNGTWMLPSRRMLQAPGGGPVGLVPDRPIRLSPAERLQVEAMRRQRELPAAYPDGAPVLDPGVVPRAELPLLSADPQLLEALRWARERLR